MESMEGSGVGVGMDLEILNFSETNRNRFFTNESNRILTTE
jgi:hypothetical protein